MCIALLNHVLKCRLTIVKPAVRRNNVLRDLVADKLPKLQCRNMQEAHYAEPQFGDVPAIAIMDVDFDQDDGRFAFVNEAAPRYSWTSRRLNVSARVMRQRPECCVRPLYFFPTRLCEKQHILECVAPLRRLDPAECASPTLRQSQAIVSSRARSRDLENSTIPDTVKRHQGR
jgi:hypothetical protein